MLTQFDIYGFPVTRWVPVLHAFIDKKKGGTKYNFIKMPGNLKLTNL